MRILTFYDFRKEFFNQGLGTYFSEDGLKTVFALLHAADASYLAESYDTTPQQICRRYSEIPEEESAGLNVVVSVDNGNVIILD